MSKSHNKKRNVGLLYEFLVRTISAALVDGNQKKSSQALKLIKKYFKQDSELYREFRLINSLVRTTVSSEAVAASILQEAKAAARSHDVSALDREKSLLISAINKTISDDDFYDQNVNEYRVYATVQTLVNDWRNPRADIGRLAQYEDQLVKWLVTEKASNNDVSMSDDSPGAARLLMKVMMRKLNEKYGDVLSPEQKQLLKAYAFSTVNDDKNIVADKLCEMKTNLLQQIDSFLCNENENEYVVKKMNEVREQVVSESLESIDDGTVTRFMLYTKLNDELCSKE